MPDMKHFQSHGYTLLEIIIVISILSVLSILAVGGFAAFATKHGDDAAARVALGALEEAHARTLAARNDVAYGVHFATSSVTIFVAPTYTAGTSTNDVRTFPARTELSSIALTGGTYNVTFARLRGDASATGTVTVSRIGDTTLARTITIHASGFVEVND